MSCLCQGPNLTALFSVGVSRGLVLFRIKQPNSTVWQHLASFNSWNGHHTSIWAGFVRRAVTKWGRQISCLDEINSPKMFCLYIFIPALSFSFFLKGHSLNGGLRAGGLSTYRPVWRITVWASKAVLINRLSILRERGFHKYLIDFGLYWLVTCQLLYKSVHL